jgi:hypothetical protein
MSLGWPRQILVIIIHLEKEENMWVQIFKKKNLGSNFFFLNVGPNFEVILKV